MLFLGIVVVPLIVAGFLVRVAVAHEVDRRTDFLLQGQGQAIGAAWLAASQSAASRTRMAAQDIAPAVSQGRNLSASTLQKLVTKARDQRGLDYLVVQESGRTVGSLRMPRLLRGAPAITLEDILAPGPLTPLLIRSTVAIGPG